MQPKAAFAQINVVVADMGATLDFYRRLGLEIAANADAVHALVTLPNGVLLQFDDTGFVPQWDSGYDGSIGGSTVLGFQVATRGHVDALYAELTQAGYRGRQLPYDAFWGARYAIVEDPNGNPVGLMSVIDKARKFWPPVPPPPG